VRRDRRVTHEPLCRDREMEEIATLALHARATPPGQRVFRRTRSHRTTAEVRLLSAVLEDAIQRYLRDLNARQTRDRLELAELKRWFEARDRLSLFGFENICHILGIDPETLRASLRNTARGRHRIQSAVRPDRPSAAGGPETPRR
jgi:hypothetical protein